MQRFQKLGSGSVCIYPRKIAKVEGEEEIRESKVGEERAIYKNSGRSVHG